MSDWLCEWRKPELNISCSIPKMCPTVIAASVLSGDVELKGPVALSGSLVIDLPAIRVKTLLVFASE